MAAEGRFALEQKTWLPWWVAVPWRELQGLRLTERDDGFEIMSETFDTEAQAERAAKRLLKRDLEAQRDSTLPREVTYVWGEDD